jgi:hypothetical protein
VPRLCLLEQTRATLLAEQILLGLALAGIGILLLGLAISAVSQGRPITRAWIVAVLGLVFFVPGAVVTGQGIASAFFGSKRRPKGNSGRARPGSS